MRYSDKTYSYLSFLNWIRDYSADSLRKDTNAGLTVGIMLIPQVSIHSGNLFSLSATGGFVFT